MARSRREAIAIVGLGCRFPGGGGPAAFWRLIRDGRDAISEVPAERWDCTHLYDPDPSTPGKMSTRWGGFVDEIDRFDARFFGVAPREAPFIDPQQRLLLEVAWEALEDAGLAVDRLAGSRTGVFIGIGSHDYSLLGWSELSTISAYTGPGTSASIAANRISYLFDFHGPSIAVDTACSASLVAAHLACQSLWAGESTIALVGGVNALLLPVGTIGLSKAGAMARDGRCKVFDARADGYVRSEGAGVVVLKPLSRALADRDAIYGSILGTAVNANGRTNGLMAPNGRAQEAVIREAWQQANVSPGLADYVEAHGTGTQLGDPIEAKALGAVFGSTRESGRTCVLGSVKANVGHLEAAAGIAGLIKVALMLRHGAIPPSLHFKTPNPHIPFERLPLRVTERLEPWADSGRRLAGVSSSGFGGANAHLVVEGPPRAAARSMTESPNPDAANVLPISARSETALRTLVERYVEALGRAFDQRASVQRICHTAAVRRTHHLEQRVAFVGRTAEELRRELSGWVDGSQEGSLRSSTHTPSRGGRELVFIFSGHGSQWSGMGRALMREEPAFRAAVNQCETAFAPYVDWSLRDVLDANAACARQPSIDVVQPALFAVQIALAALWRSWGIEPAAVVGHSMGEVAAAQVAGILSLDDAARIICRRSALLERKSGKGAMAATELALAEAEAAVAPYHGRLSIAASNGPRSTVLSGDEGALADVMERLGREGVFARRVQVDVASHSAHMDDLANELMAALEGLRPGSAHVPFYSTVTGGREDGNGCGPCYWVDNLRRPVLFSSAIEHTLGDGHHAFLELSPHPLLLPAVEDVCRHATRTALVIGSLRRDEDPRTSLLRSLSALYVNGSRVDWAALFGEPMEPVPLPSYPWDRERFWLDTSPRIPERRPAASAEGNHPLLQPRVDPAFQPDRSCWHVDVAGERAAYLADHQLRGKAVMPAAAYIEMALAATTDQRVFEPLHVRDLRLEQVLSIDAASSPEVQVTRSRDAHDSVLVQVFSRARSADSHWNEHVRVIVARQTEPAHSRPRLDIDSVRSRCPEHRPAERFYTDLAACGLHYGPRFRAVLDTWRGDAEAVLEVALPDDALDPDTYIAHPVLVDAACFQAVAAVLPRLEDVSPLDTFLPVRVESLEVLQRLPSRLWAHITARGTLESDMIGCDVTMTDADGYVVMRASGIEVRRIAGLPDSARRAWEDCLYEVRWERSFRVAATSVRQTNSRWLICGDRGAVGERLGAALEALGESAAHVAYGAAYQSGPARRYCINPDRPEDFRRLLEEAFDDGASCSGIVFLWSLDGPDARNVSVERLRDAERIGTRAALHLVQALLRVAWRQQPRTWIVTRAAQRVDARDRDPSVAHSTLWGFGRVVRHEHPELQCTLIDVAAELSEDPAGQLAGELVNGDAEVEIALRSGDRFVARLARYEGGARSTARSAAPPFALSIASPGNLQTLRLESCARRPPRPGEVEVEVHAAGLNFLDVLVAMGVQPNRDARARLHGLELSGTVSRVGPRVTTLEPGDEVVGFAEDVFGSFALASEAWLVRKPANLSFGAAATLPAAFVTASYALNRVARLGAGERVLIHSAAGGTGLAAVQMARRVGAEIFATAGSSVKRDYLRSIGITSVGDSRSSSFATDVMRWTDGRGVDVVLNSLSGRLIEHGLESLAPYGRFVDIAKRDIYQNRVLSLSPFRRSLSYSAVDIASMAVDRPDVVAAALQEVVALAERGQIEPLPRRELPIARAEEGFREMAQGRHIGKIVFAVSSGSSARTRSTDNAHHVPERSGDVSRRSPIRAAGGPVLITGGFGYLGLKIADWLASQQTRALVLVGRSVPSQEASREIARLRDRGVHIDVAVADVSRPDEIEAVLHRTREAAPLTGIVHAAGVLDDRVLTGLEDERLRRVMAPKVFGAWNLHALTLGDPLEFFVLCSSAASILGSPGQANYAAGNAFLDALAQYRDAHGLPALAINWGPFSSGGLAAAATRGARLRMRGIQAMSADQGLEVLAYLLDAGAVQAAAMALDVRQWCQFYPTAADARLLDSLAADGHDERTPASTGSSLRERLGTLDAAERLRVLEAHIQAQVAYVLGIDAGQVTLHTPFSVLGLDSLMALEARNRLERTLQVSLPATVMWAYPEVEQLAGHLVRELGWESRDAAQAAAQTTFRPDAAIARVRALSDEEAARRLAERLPAAGPQP